MSIVNTYRIKGVGRQEVAAAGTPEALGASTATCTKVDVQACTDNVGLVTVGTVDIDQTDAGRTGIALAAGDVYPVAATDLSQVFVDAINSNDGVNFIYYA